MLKQLRPAILMTVLMTRHPGSGLSAGHDRPGSGALSRTRQGGSLIVKDGKVIGSELIGQQFTSAKYFHGRPSAAGNGYDAANSSGSNLGPTSKKLVDRVKGDAAALAKENPGTPVPVDLVTSSASGLDPDITPAAALFQVPRVAAARKLPPDAVRKLVEDHVDGRLLGLIGEPHVNVLKLNMASGRHAGSRPG